MAKITATIEKEHYKTTIKSATNTIIADEPTDMGGQNLGFSPSELLASALAACTSITLRMYANRKEWALEKVNVEVDFQRDNQTNKTVFQRKIELVGALDEEQKTRMLSIANACPVHKILTNSIEIQTEIN